MKVPSNSAVVLVTFCGLVTMVATQRVTKGTCPNLPAMKNFNVTAYAGRWYMVENYWISLLATTSCTTIDYAPNFDVDVRHIEGITRINLRNKGHTTYSSKDGTPDVKLEITLPRALPFSIYWPYKILDTDYVNYTIKYTCFQIEAYRVEGMWILSKSAAELYNSKTKQKVHQFLRRMGLSTSALRPTAYLKGKKCPW